MTYSCPTRGHSGLAAGDLPGKGDAGQGLQPQGAVQKPWRIEEGVAVKPAQPRELGLLQPRNGPENPHLLGMFELGLEADDVPQRAERIILPELDEIGRASCRERVCQSVSIWVGAVSLKKKKNHR